MKTTTTTEGKFLAGGGKEIKYFFPGFAQAFLVRVALFFEFRFIVAGAYSVCCDASTSATVGTSP
ncbi:MAG: hypothetical protein ABJL67_13130 [Sulfitobacter sp.]